MKKIVFTALTVVSLFSVSCTVAHTAVVTNNAVGSKRGKLVTHPFKRNAGLSYESAMKNGEIKKLGIAEYKAKVFLTIPVQKLEVTGE